MQGGQNPLSAESGLSRFVLNHGSTKITGLNERDSDASVRYIVDKVVDKLEKRNGEWRIKRRTVVMDWNQNLPNASIWDEGMFSVLKIRGERSKSDPVYRRD